MLKTCPGCGSPSFTTWCIECRPPRQPKNTSPRAAGYDAAWDRLSKRARAIQPWCSDCGSPYDLTADHSPEAWARKAAGKTIRLQDVDVLCRSCNSERGAARGEHTRGETPTPEPRGAAPVGKVSVADGNGSQ